LHRPWADAENVADVDARFAVAQPQENLGLSIRNLQPRLQLGGMFFGIEFVEADQHLILAILCDHDQFERSARLLDPDRPSPRSTLRQQALDSRAKFGRQRHIFPAPAGYDPLDCALCQRGAPEKTAARVGCHHQAARCVETGDAGVLSTPLRHMNTNPGQQLRNVGRLADIIDAADLKRFDDMFAFAQSGHENDRDMREARSLLDPDCRLEPVHPRHHRIHQDEIGHNMRQQLQCSRAGGGNENPNVHCLQRIGQHRQGALLVIDDQHGIPKVSHAVQGRCCPRSWQARIDRSGRGCHKGLQPVLWHWVPPPRFALFPPRCREHARCGDDLAGGRQGPLLRRAASGAD